MNTLKQLIKLQCKEILMEAAAAAPAAAPQKPGLLARAGAAIKNVFGGGAAKPVAGGAPAAAGAPVAGAPAAAPVAGAAGAQPVAQAAAPIEAAASKVEAAAKATVTANAKAVAAGGAKEKLEKWQIDWLNPEGAVQKGIGDRAKEAAGKELQHSVTEFEKKRKQEDAKNKKQPTVMSDEVGTLVAKAALASFVKKALEEKDAEITFNESTVLLGTILYGRRK